MNNEEKMKEIIRMSAEGVTNRQIAVNLSIKYSKVSYWKRQMRNAGIEIKSHVGRPRLNMPKFILGKLEE